MNRRIIMGKFGEVDDEEPRQPGPGETSPYPARNEDPDAEIPDGESDIPPADPAK